MDTLHRARTALDLTLTSGIDVKEIPGYAAMIRDLETVEKYVKCLGAAGCVYDSGGESESWLIKRIESELAAAETYCAEWLKTGNAIYKQLAADELRHADIFIKEAKAADVSPEALQGAIKRHSAIAADLA